MAALLDKLKGNKPNEFDGQSCLVKTPAASNATNGILLNKIDTDSPSPQPDAFSQDPDAAVQMGSPLSPTRSLTFAPLPPGRTQPRRSSVTLGVAARAQLLSGQVVPTSPGNESKTEDKVYTASDVGSGISKVFRRFSRSRSRSAGESDNAQQGSPTQSLQVNNSAVSPSNGEDSPSSPTSIRSVTNSGGFLPIKEETNVPGDSRPQSRRGSVDMQAFEQARVHPRADVLGFSYNTEDVQERRGRDFRRGNHSNDSAIEEDTLSDKDVKMEDSAVAEPTTEICRPTTVAGGVEKII